MHVGADNPDASKCSMTTQGASNIWALVDAGPRASRLDAFISVFATKLHHCRPNKIPATIAKLVPGTFSGRLQ